LTLLLTTLQVGLHVNFVRLFLIISRACCVLRARNCCSKQRHQVRSFFFCVHPAPCKTRRKDYVVELRVY
jgi:hypothetical protein